MKFEKKHIIASALILALGAAVYVNWQLGGRQSTVKELGAASLVNAAVTATADEGKGASALTPSQENFFAAERVKRQNTEDAVLDAAEKVFDLESAREEDKSEAQKHVETLLKNITVQQSIESIVKAKGFSDCLCCISDEGVTVIVPKEQLNKTAVLVIDDAVTAHYKVSYENISVVGAE